MTRHGTAALLAAMMVAACTPASVPVATPNLRADFSVAIVEKEPRPMPGACWHASVRPALFETVTEQVLVTPESRDATGAIVTPAGFRTETSQSEVRPRQTVWFRVPCPQDGIGEPSFVASLQRALKARGYFGGAVTGEMDADTDAAVLRYQSANGLDNAVLSLAAAQALGLVAVAR